MRRADAIRHHFFSSCVVVSRRAESASAPYNEFPRSRSSKQTYDNPLSTAVNPSLRNIVVPDSAHARRGSADTVSAESLRKRAQRAIALQLRKDMLWEGAVVDDASHKVAQHFLSLRTNPRYRKARKLLIVGGKHQIRELCEGGHAPRHLMLPAGTSVPEWVDRNRTQVVVATQQVVDDVVPGTDGFVGDFDIPEPPPVEELIANKQRMERVLVLDNVEDAGELGTLLRTAAGFQYDAVLLVNHCADLTDPRVVRASRAVHFQSAVPLYQLREEDGDDAFGVVRHVLERNKLEAVYFTPHVDNTAAEDELVPRPTVTTSGADSAAGTPVVTESAKTLSSLLLEAATDDNFSRGGLPRGFMVFASPDRKKGSLPRRLEANVPQPLTRVLLDIRKVDTLDSSAAADDALLAPTVDFVASTSSLLYALRPHGEWDYLPPWKQSSASTMALQTQRAKPSIGPDRPLPLDASHLSLTREEQVNAAHLHNTKKKERRMARRSLSDYDAWMTAETRRIRNLRRTERRTVLAPWLEPDGKSKFAKKSEEELPDDIPNIINDYRQNLDRDMLREEFETSTQFTRPPNYESKVRMPERKRPNLPPRK